MLCWQHYSIWVGKRPLITCSSLKIKFTLATLNKAHHLWDFFLYSDSIYPIQFCRREINRKIYKTLNLIVTPFYHHNTKYFTFFEWIMSPCCCVRLECNRVCVCISRHKIKGLKIYLFSVKFAERILEKLYYITFRIFNVIIL